MAWWALASLERPRVCVARAWQGRVCAVWHDGRSRRSRDRETAYPVAEKEAYAWHDGHSRRSRGRVCAWQRSMCVA